MADVGYTAALVLAAIFAWAGGAKLRSRATTVRTFRAFGLAAPEALGIAVPVVELGLAVGLVVVPGWAALVALAVLVAFSTILLRAVRAGVDVGCGCFGTARTEPVSVMELARNAMLGALAVAASFAAAPTVPGLDAVVVVTTAVAAGAVVLALGDVKRRTGAVFRLDLSPGPGQGPA